MKRTTVLLPDDTAKILKLEAERRGVSPSEIVRQAVTEHLDASRPRGFLKLAGKLGGAKGPQWSGKIPDDHVDELEEAYLAEIEDIAEQNGLARRDR
jgi:hypothetical protein